MDILIIIVNYFLKSLVNKSFYKLLEILNKNLNEFFGNI